MKHRKLPLGITACLLTLACLMSLFTACGQKNETKTTEEVTNGADEYPDDLGAFDFGNEKFKVLSVASREGTYTTFDVPEDYQGDQVDDAVYSRNRIIEQRFNVVFDGYTAGDEGGTPGYTVCYNRLRQEALAPTENWDLIMLINRDAYTAIQEEMICLPSELKHIDMSKDYYLRDVNDALTIDGVPLFAYSDESVYTFERSVCIVFNQSEVTSLGMEDPYALVKSGDWTYQKMFEMVKSATRMDADGKTAFYGCSGMSDYTATSYWFGCGQTMLTTTNGNTGMRFSIGTSEAIIKITEEILALVDGGQMELKGWEGSDEKWIGTFKDGRALFQNNIVGKVRLLRNVKDWDYGVLPYPKYSETQDHYYSRVVDAWLHVVPKSCSDIDRASVILEALASGSSQYVFPAYYEKVLKYQIMRNPQDIEMLELIRAHRTFDLADVTWAKEIRMDLVSKVFMDRTMAVSAYGNSMVYTVNASLVKPLLEMVEKLKMQDS